MNSDGIGEIQRKIEELNRRMPPHSVPPALIEELDRLEEQLREAKRLAGEGDG